MELNRKIFRANDIRGLYPSEVNGRSAFLIARALSRYYKKSVVIGHDVRLSSPALYRQLKKGLRINKKLKIIDAGLITSPTMYFLVNYWQLDGGIIVTASHAPKEFNGFKIVRSGAQMINGDELWEIINAYEGK